MGDAHEQSTERHPESTAGRFLAGVTETPIGELTNRRRRHPVVDAHVRTGWRNRKRWDAPAEWLEGFESLSYATDSRTIVLGDSATSTRGFPALACPTT